MEFLGTLWNGVVFRPMLNTLLFLYSVFGTFGMAIILFTALVRVLMLPLTIKQLHATKKMSELAPRLKEIQQKYPKDRPRISQETMRLYKEAGINPLGCLGPVVVQFPIWIGLYQAIIQALPPLPEGLVDLGDHLYSWLPMVHQAIPVQSRFLWMDLSQPDVGNPILPILVFVTMWVQQKMTTLPATDPQQAQTNQMMLWMMPGMFAFFTFQFPSGLALYWVVSNLIGVIMQYFITGWGSLFPLFETASAAPPATPAAKELASDGKPGSDREDSRGSDRAGAKAVGRKQRRGRGRGPERGEARDPGPGGRTGPGPGDSSGR